MMTALIVFHVIVCVLLILIVLLQFGKGAEAGAMLGTAGSSQNIFTSNAKGNFFTKLTAVLAILFFANSIALTIFKSKEVNTSVFDGQAPVAAPLNPEAIAPTGEPTTTTPVAPASPTETAK